MPDDPHPRRGAIAIDADKRGRGAAQRIARGLADRALVRIADLALRRTDGYDLTDWLLANPSPAGTQRHAPLPERDRLPIKTGMSRVGGDRLPARALEQLGRLADELDHTHRATGSLRERMEETLTVIGLGIKGKLKRTPPIGL